MGTLGKVALRLRQSALFFAFAAAAGLRSGGATPLRADAPGAPGGASSSIEELRDVVRGLAGPVSSLEAQV